MNFEYRPGFWRAIYEMTRGLFSKACQKILMSSALPGTKFTKTWGQVIESARS